MARLVKSRGLIPGSLDITEGFEEETDTHRYRMKVPSESSNRMYLVSQNKESGEWQCSCPGWKFKKEGKERHCKHLSAMLPTLEALDRLEIEAPMKPKAKKKKATKKKRKPSKKKVIEAWAEFAEDLIYEEGVTEDVDPKEFGAIMHEVLLEQGTINSVLWEGDLPSGTEDKVWVRSWLAANKVKAYCEIVNGPDGKFAKRALKEMGLKLPRKKKVLTKKVVVKNFEAKSPAKIVDLLEKLLDACEEGKLKKLSVTAEYK